jgi:hypothetical protein
MHAPTIQSETRLLNKEFALPCIVSFSMMQIGDFQRGFEGILPFYYLV